MKRVAFRLVASVATFVLRTRVAGQAFPVPRVARGKSAAHLIPSLPIAAVFSFLTSLLFFCSTARAQSQPADQLAREFKLPDTPESTPSASAQPQQNASGTVSGQVVDQTGKGVACADVTP